MLSRKQRGFTLVELLVVIAIISLLASVVLASFSKTREKARDSKRVQDLLQVQKALELYKAENNKYPPDPKGTDNAGISCWQCSGTQYDDGKKLEAIAKFLNPRPCDASTCNRYGSGNNDRGFIYKVNSTCSDYKMALARTVENPNNIPTILKDNLFLSDNNTISVASSDQAKAWRFSDLVNIGNNNTCR